MEFEMYTDSKKRTWLVLEREDGSVSVYYTKEDSPAHHVVFDTLDAEKQNNAEKVDQNKKIGLYHEVIKFFDDHKNENYTANDIADHVWLRIGNEYSKKFTDDKSAFLSMTQTIRSYLSGNIGPKTNWRRVGWGLYRSA